MKKRLISIIASFIFLFPFSFSAFAYPDTAFDVPLSIGKADGGLEITSDNRYLFSANGKQLSKIDTGTFALTTDQPPVLSSTDGDNGNIQSIIYVSNDNSIYAILDTGKLLTFALGSITNKPSVQTVYDGRSLGPMEANTNVSPIVFYPAYQTDDLLYKFTNGSGSPSSTTIDLKSPLVQPRTFDITDMFFNSDTSEIYIGTDIGYVIHFSPSIETPTPAAITVDEFAQTSEIAGLAAPLEGSTKLYCPEKTSSGDYIPIDVIDMSTNILGTPMLMDTDFNSSFVSIVTQVDTTTGRTYGFVSGQQGISLFNTTNDTLLNADGTNCTIDKCDPIATTKTGPMVASTDGYIYLSNDSGLTVITDRPWIEVPTVVYKDSTGAVTTILREHGTFELTFNSDTAGTYKVYSGGSIDMSGHIMTDTSGQTSGTVVAATDKTAIFAYDTNVGILEGGTNTIFIFVTDSASLTGRRATTIEADIPPKPVTITSTGFGNGRAYLNFTRLTATNVSYYNLYADTDAETVKTKTTVSAVVTQPASGTSVSGVISSLTNGTTYYLAIEGVNTAGTVGPRTYSLPDGSQASVLPQETVGPAGYSGETGGCSLIRGGR